MAGETPADPSPHFLRNQEAQRSIVLAVSPSCLFSSGLQLMGWSSPHEGQVSLLQLTSLETPSQRCPRLRHPGGSKSSQADKM